LFSLLFLTGLGVQEATVMPCRVLYLLPLAAYCFIAQGCSKPPARQSSTGYRLDEMPFKVAPAARIQAAIGHTPGGSRAHTAARTSGAWDGASLANPETLIAEVEPGRIGQKRPAKYQHSTKPRAETSSSVGSAFADNSNPAILNVLTSEPDSVFHRLLAELDDTMERHQLRVLPRLARPGIVQGLGDLMHLSGVNLSVVQVDILSALAKGDPVHRRLRYIARLYNKEFHLIAGREITSIHQLHNRKVNIGEPGTGTHLMARRIFKQLGINADFTTHDRASSYDKLRSGEIAAAVHVTPRPSPEIAEFEADGRFHLVAVSYRNEFPDYVPAEFEMRDYPNLIRDEKKVETIAVGTVLAVMAWPQGSERHKRVVRFIDTYFSRFEDIRDGSVHPKWHEATPSATVPGWRRFKPAQEWLNRRSRNNSAHNPRQS
jgi:TRAP-type uncharacterized transport system substrate-binding protein